MGVTRKDLVDELTDLVAAARSVIDNWSSGDLAQAVNGLEEAVECAEGVLTDVGSAPWGTER